MAPIRETLKQAGMIHCGVSHGEHLLHNKATGQQEIWAANKGHASYGLIYKNTHLEFCRSVPARVPSGFKGGTIWQSNPLYGVQS